MHVELDIGIPLLTQHERDQGVKTRNFLAVKNGDEANPILALTGQDAETFTSVTITPLQYGDKVELKMFNVDQAGNFDPSQPLDGVLVLADTTPPDGPVGSFNFKVREVVAPPADPVPVEEGDGGSPPSG